MEQTPLQFDKSTPVCFINTPVSSSGMWFGDDPLRTMVPLLMLQMSMIVVCCRGAHAVLRRLGQVEVTSQIIVGLLLGPSVAGRIPWYRSTLFPPRSWMHLITVADVGYVLFVFLVGVKTDLSLIMSSGRKPMAVGLAGILFPMCLVFMFNYALQEFIPADLVGVITAVGRRWCMTSFAVVSHTLGELGLLNSSVGRVATSASLLANFVFVVALSTYTSLRVGIWKDNWLFGVLSSSSLLALALFILFAVRPVTLRMIRKTPPGQPLDERHFAAVLAMAFGCGMLSEVLGYHVSTGMFFVGLALPSGPPLGTTLVRRLEGLVLDLFIPAFLALAGFKTELSAVTDGKQVAYMQLFLCLTFLGRFAGVMAPALYCRMPLRDAFSLALVMNIRGITDVDVLNEWQNEGIAPNQTYAMAVFFILASSGIATPLLKHVYRPSAAYAAYKGRTVQHSGGDAELRVLACVHGEEDVAPIVDVLQAVSRTAANVDYKPICVYVLHLLQLLGQAAAVLVPHRRSRSQGSTEGNPTDHIVHAFRHIERGCPGGYATVHPFVSICPYASMHLDICALALERNVALLVLPFHKKMAIHGALEVANSAHRAVNVNVLSYAPCSVGILVNQRPFKGPASTVVVPSRYDAQLSVAVYFLGGPDDREALSFAARMAGNPNIGLTVVRFRLPTGCMEIDAADERLDDEVVDQLLLNGAVNKRMEYHEEVARDGEGVVSLIRAMGHEFNLVIVGRRQGMESPMVAGMAEWSEYPELGVLGDLLASTDLGRGASTLVVQQQTGAWAEQQAQRH